MFKRVTMVLLALVVLMSLVLMTGCSSGPAAGSGAEVVSEDSGDQASADGGKDTAVGTRENPLPVGTTAKVGDWEITVTSATPNANDAVAAENQFNSPPVAGSQYVLVAVTAKYVGAESGTFWVDMSTKFIGPAGNTFDQGGSSMAVAPSSITDAGETFPGASVSGNLLFEVPADQVQGGAVIMEASFSLDDTRTFFAIQ